MRTAPFALALFLALPRTCLGIPPGYALLESVAASVNGEVIFLSDVSREACFSRCGAVPGQPAEEISLAKARERLVADTLVLQEQNKLGLGAVDNAAIPGIASGSAARLDACASPCAKGIAREEIEGMVRRRLLTREFLEQRVGAFIDISDEDVRREVAQRTRDNASPEELDEGNVRRFLYAQKAATEIRNWFSRATSKSRIVLAPLEEP